MKPTWCTIFLIYFVNFIYNLYIFRTSPGPSSGGTTVFIRHLLFCYSVYLAVWCAHHTACYTECRAPSWFHLQDYMEIHGQQNLKFSVGMFSIKFSYLYLC
jgi:hypothetical protein